MERYKITAEHIIDGYENNPTVEYEDLKGTFAEEVYNAVHKKFWEVIQACYGCKYKDSVEEWEMPCKECKRIARDYYRQDNENDN